MSIEFLDCLKRERDISIKAMSSGGKMAFRLILPLTHEHPSGERADEVKGEGAVVVVVLFFQYLRNNVIRNNVI